MKLLLAAASALAIGLAGSPGYATVTNPTVTTTAIATGSSNTFNYGFLIPLQMDGVTPAAQVTTVIGGVTMVLPTTGYTVTGVGRASGGTVTIIGGNLPAGSTVTITRDYQYVQPIAVPNTGFYPHVVEQSADQLEYQIQQLAVLLPVPASTYTPGLGINISTGRVISADTTILATNDYVNQQITGSQLGTVPFQPPILGSPVQWMQGFGTTSPAAQPSFVGRVGFTWSSGFSATPGIWSNLYSTAYRINFDQPGQTDTTYLRRINWLYTTHPDWIEYQSDLQSPSWEFANAQSHFSAPVSAVATANGSTISNGHFVASGVTGTFAVGMELSTGAANVTSITGGGPTTWTIASSTLSYSGPVSGAAISGYKNCALSFDPADPIADNEGFTSTNSSISGFVLTVAGATGTPQIGDVLTGPNMATGTMIIGGGGSSFTVNISQTASAAEVDGAGFSHALCVPPVNIADPAVKTWMAALLKNNGAMMQSAGLDNTDVLNAYKAYGHYGPDATHTMMIPCPAISQPACGGAFQIQYPAALNPGNSKNDIYWPIDNQAYLSYLRSQLAPNMAMVINLSQEGSNAQWQAAANASSAVLTEGFPEHASVANTVGDWFNGFPIDGLWQNYAANITHINPQVGWLPFSYLGTPTDSGHNTAAMTQAEASWLVANVLLLSNNFANTYVQSTSDTSNISRILEPYPLAIGGYGAVVANADVTTGSATIAVSTGTATVSGLSVGMRVTGQCIPDNDFITAVGSWTTASSTWSVTLAANPICTTTSSTVHTMGFGQLPIGIPLQPAPTVYYNQIGVVSDCGTDGVASGGNGGTFQGICVRQFSRGYAFVNPGCQLVSGSCTVGAITLTLPPAPAGSAGTWWDLWCNNYTPGNTTTMTGPSGLVIFVGSSCPVPFADNAIPES